MVTPAGFEPAISGVKGQRPGPLDDGAINDLLNKYIYGIKLMQDGKSIKS